VLVQRVEPDHLFDDHRFLSSIQPRTDRTSIHRYSSRGWAGLTQLAHLSWHESQRAEYLADALAARIAGTEAAISALKKLRYGVSFTTVQRLALNDAAGDLFVELRRRVERSVQAAASQPEEAPETRYRLDRTHPPTDYRVKFLRSRACEPGRLRLSPAECEALEAELAALSPRIQKQLVDSYLRRLYR
jgi:hypothetical protein